MSWFIGPGVAADWSASGSPTASSRIARSIFNRLPERNAEVFEVLIRQLWQDVSLDRAFAKCRLVLAKSETS